MSRLVLVPLVLCLLLVAIANAEEAVGSLNGAWAGTWLLDPKASDSVDPMLVLMKTPWIARKAAAAMTPTMRITALGHGGLRVINENPIRTTNQEIFIDGVKRERGEMHGLATREVKTDERQDLFCDLGAVRRALPEEVGQLRLQLSAPRLARFQVRCVVLSLRDPQSSRVIARAAYRSRLER